MATPAKKFTHSMKLVLSEKVTLANGKKAHKEVGTVNVPCPVLADFGIVAKQAVYDADDASKGQKKGEPAYEDGIPLFDDPVADWLQQAIAFRVAAMSRNRFKGGVLKTGATLAEDFEALTAETQRTGEALALRRDARTSFEAYLQSQNKKAATVTVLGELFWNSSKALASAGATYVEALAAHVGKWVATLPADKATRFAPKIAELQESINTAQEGNTLDESDLAA